MINKKFIKKGFLTLSVCLAGLSISSLNTSASNDGVEERLFKNIEIAAQKGQLSTAKEDIQRVLRLNPKHAGAIFFAGQYSFDAGNFENAAKFLNRVVNHPKYGTKASRMLAEMRLNSFRGKFKETLEVYLAGESFSQAFQLCEEALEAMPDNKEILYKATYISCMLGRQEQAERFLAGYGKAAGTGAAYAELQAFVSAWFGDGYDPETVLDQLLTITSRDLLTPPVRKRIKDLIVKTRAAEKFEAFIKREKQVPGADTGALEREFISFLIENKQYEKAMEHVNRRPIDSIDDNLLYIKILALTGQEKKAMSNARHLISAAQTDLRTYQAWLEAWMAYVEKTQQPPDGEDEGGKNFIEMADEILARLKPDKLVTSNSELLINLLRLAVMIDNSEHIKLIKPEALRIPYNFELSALLIKTCDELLIFNKPELAVELLESARNQLPENHNLHIKLAEIYLSADPAVGAKILEGVLLEKPDLMRAFLLWADCMNLSGQAAKAEEEILKRLADKTISEVARRQLNAKLEVLRMQNFISDSGSQTVASETEPADGAAPDSDSTADQDEINDPTVPKRDLSPLEPTEEELQQPEEED